MRSFSAAWLLLFLVLQPLHSQQQTEATRQESPSPDASDTGETPTAELPSAEERALRRAVTEAQGSPVDLVRGLERHLRLFPDAKRREDIEFALLKTALDLQDEPRILDYGQRFLDTGANDIAVFDRVLPLLLEVGTEDAARKALAYVERYHKAALQLEEVPPAQASQRIAWRKRVDRAISRAFTFGSRAKGQLGQFAEALTAAEQSYALQPTAEAAREMASWLHKLNRYDEAVSFLAEAFTIEDGYTTATQRAKDRGDLGLLYRTLHGNEQGLGDRVLAAYDRTRERMDARQRQLDSLAPNASITRAADFTLTGLRGDSLALSSLRGKVVVVDFWATWCGPCRKQHPLYEEVRQHFASSGAVEFLSVNTDEDRSVVQPFLEENQWDHPVYFEDGLSAFLRIASIPTTLVLGKDGQIFSRMNGFIPETFVAQLTARVDDALAAEPPTHTALRD